MTNEHELNEILKQIGTKLRHTRQLKDEKQKTVADKTGIDRAVISKVENGRYRSFNFVLLMQLTEYYGLAVTEIPFFEKIAHKE